MQHVSYPVRLRRLLTIVQALALPAVWLPSVHVAGFAATRMPGDKMDLVDAVEYALQAVDAEDLDLHAELMLIVERKGRREVVVRFARATSDVIGKGGRPPRRIVVRVRVRQDKGIRIDGKVASPIPVDELSRPMRAMLASLRVGTRGALNRLEFELSVRELPNGFVVFLDAVPYVPGAQSSVYLSPDFKVLEVVPG
jgi:hypothetical protein